MNTEVTAYIAEQEAWKQDVINTVRQVIHQVAPDIEETIRWGTPSFDCNGQVVWLFCATEWVHVSFRYGSLLDDSHGLWEEGTDTASQAKRTIKIRKGDKVPVGALKKLVKEAVANNKAGKKVEFHRPKPGENVFDVPHKYEQILKEHGVYDDYMARPYYQQKGYIEWIEQAKQEETVQKRIKTMIHELQNGQYMPPKRDRA